MKIREHSDRRFPLLALHIVQAGLLISLSACTKPTIAELSQPSTATPPEPTSSTNVSSYKLTCEEARFVKLLNLHRQNQGLQPVTVSMQGTEAARWMANDMGTKNYFSHTEPSGRDAFQRMASFGFTSQAENIAVGNADAQATFCMWKNSAGHNSNMLSASQAIGIGRAIVSGSQYEAYWVNCFGTPRDLLVEPLTTDPSCSMPTTLPGC